MSMTKRILFENNPADDVIRKKFRKDFEKARSEFIVRIPLRKKIKVGEKYRWDDKWEYSVKNAARKTGINFLPVNESIFVKTEIEKNSVLKKAEEIYTNLIARNL